MRTSIRRRHGWPSAWLLAALALLPPVWARTATGGPPLRPEEYTRGEAVRRAFRAAVADTRRATARVFADGAEAAYGAVVGSDGWVLTKASQLQGRVSCRLYDGRELPARVVGVHSGLDLAMLKLDADGLATVAWREEQDPPVGAWLATAADSELPLGVGILSVKRRAVPHEKGVLGISIADDKGGPKITKVFPNSSADKAGLRVDDVITHVAGTAVETGAAISGLLAGLQPGDTLTIRLRRGNELLDVRATLGYPLESLLNRSMFQNSIGGELSVRRSGFAAVLQHDTVLRPQECGGPVVDLAGRVVGLNIARAGRTETFALPASEILPVLEELKSGRLAPPELVRFQIRPEPPPLPESVED